LIAYTYSYDPAGNHLDQITAMRDHVDSLRAAYDLWDPLCNRFPLCKDKDCVWPGDFDHNSIVDHRDLLMVGAWNGHTGFTRYDGLVSWRGHVSDEWSSTINGINAKHGDGDGNGIIDEDDLTWNKEYYWFTNPYYHKDEQFPQGPEIYLTSNPMMANGAIRSINVNAGIPLQNVLGMAYELDFDTSLYTLIPIRISNCPSDTNIICLGTQFNPVDPRFNITPAYAFVTTDHEPLQFSTGALFDRYFGGLRLKPNITLADLPDTIIIRLKNLIAIDPDGNDLHFGSNVLKVPNYLITGTSGPATNEPYVFLYPNPADQHISIDTELDSDVLIFNLQGQWMKKVNAADMHKIIDISGLPAGLYFLKYSGIGGTYKFVKQ